MDDEYISAARIIRMIGCGRSTFYKWIKAERFPQGIRLGGLRRWSLANVLQWIDSQAQPPDAIVIVPPSPVQRRIKRTRLTKHRAPASRPRS